MKDKLPLDSLVSKTTTANKAFYKPSGAFVSEKSPEEIIAEIKASKKFRKKEIRL